MKIVDPIFIVLLISVLLLSCNNTKKLTDKDSISNSSLTKVYQSEVLDFQKKLHEDYTSTEESPLTEEEIEKFKSLGGHKFFPLQNTLRIVARLDRTVNEKNVQFKTSTDRIAIYDVYGIAHFEMEGKPYAVKIYQSPVMKKMAEYKDHLFFPFNDLTNGNETYGGGRYIDLKIPNDDKLIIDFNKAYNPYCAYSDKYSCPVPPLDNYIDKEIKAGIMNLEGFKD